MAYNLNGVLRGYDSGGADINGILGQMSQYNKYGLTDEELGRGLTEFGDWHRGRFGSGFTDASSAPGIAQGAVQNALNFRATNQRNATPSEGNLVAAGAPNVIGAPGAAEARATGESAGMDKFRDYQANSNSVNDWLTAGFGQDLTEPSIRSMWGGVASATGKSGAEIANAVRQQSMDNWMWLGPEARKAALIRTLGTNPTPFVNADLMRSQQGKTASVGQAAQATNGDGGQFMLNGALAVGLAGLGGAAFSGLGGAGVTTLGELGAAGGLTGGELGLAGVQAATPTFAEIGAGAAAGGAGATTGLGDLWGGELTGNTVAPTASEITGTGLTPTTINPGLDTSVMTPADAYNLGDFSSGAGAEGLGGFAGTDSLAAQAASEAGGNTMDFNFDELFQSPDTGPLDNLTPQLPNEFAPPETPGMSPADANMLGDMTSGGGVTQGSQGVLDQLRNLLPNMPPGLSSAIKALLLGSPGTGAARGLSGGGSGSAGSDGGGGLLGMAPGLFALQYARNQAQNNTFDANAYRNSMTDPYNEQTARGLGSLTSSLGQRGVLGSSFGDQSITNYNVDRGRGLADITGSAGMTIAQQGLKQQAVNNALYGRAFDVLGRGLTGGGTQRYSSLYDQFFGTPEAT